MIDRPAVVHRDSWAGRTREHVVIVGETPKRYRCRSADGTVRLVPKTAVSFEDALLPGELINFKRTAQAAWCVPCGGTGYPTDDENEARRIGKCTACDGTGRGGEHA